jgi:predicted nuclease of restriction endonuclease-like RecB superfamily
MLPPELTRARKREGKLSLSPLSPAERARATEVAELLLGVTRAALGEPREDVQASWAALPVAAKERKLLAGLTHLLESHAEFTAPTSAEPEAVRRAVFERAARRRAELPPGEHLQRGAVLAEVAEEMAMTAEQLEQALFADLRSAQRLERCGLSDAAALVSEYELVQVQSVLLRAERIEAEVRAAKPDAYRDLFRKLKFRQLLHRIEPLEPSGYRLEIDGPMSLFGATTKYGLELALSLPALLSCGSLRLKADLRWGKRRERLRFEQVYSQASGQDAVAGVRTEVLELLGALGAAKSELEARLCEDLIDLTERGGGVLVPDLELRRRGAAPNEPKVLVELLGFWSRDAVFRRIEAAERGLSHPVLFVVSSRLRVSEELLDGVEAASLYVYKGKVNAHALLRKVEGLLAEQHGHPGEAPAGRATRLRSKTARRPD